MKQRGWDEFEIGSVMKSFKAEITEEVTSILPEDREYSENNSRQASVAHWRVVKPIFNQKTCINCMFCWVYCPDTSILARDKAMVGVDYVHCKGCGVCSQVCPTNPKSLLMFDERTDPQEARDKWPKKDENK